MEYFTRSLKLGIVADLNHDIIHDTDLGCTKEKLLRFGDFHIFKFKDSQDRILDSTDCSKRNLPF